MANKAKRHVHKYQQIPFNYSGRVWACRLPDCNHYMPKHLEVTIEGKNSICWQCGNVFQLDSDSMAEESPRCRKCRGLLTEETELPLSPELKAKMGIH